MFKKISKHTLFTMLVLLAGQIPIGRGTIASHFLDAILAGFSWSGEQIRSSHAWESFENFIHPPRPRELRIASGKLVKEMREVHVPAVQRVPAPEPAPQPETDEVTASDQEALMRVLP